MLQIVSIFKSENIIGCKYSFIFLKKEEQGISMVNSATYLKMSTDEFRIEVVPEIYISKQNETKPTMNFVSLKK